MPWIIGITAKYFLGQTIRIIQSLNIKDEKINGSETLNLAYDIQNRTLSSDY